MKPMAQAAPAAPTAPVPPQNLDAEESVLGAMMLSPGAIGAVILNPLGLVEVAQGLLELILQFSAGRCALDG